MRSKQWFSKTLNLFLFMGSISLIAGHFSHTSNLPLLPAFILPLGLSLILFVISFSSSPKLGSVGRFIFATAAAIYLTSYIVPSYGRLYQSFSPRLLQEIYPLVGIYALAELISRLLSWFSGPARDPAHWERYFALTLFSLMIVSNYEKFRPILFVPLSTLGQFILGNVGLALLYQLLKPQVILSKTLHKFQK